MTSTSNKFHGYLICCFESILSGLQDYRKKRHRSTPRAFA